MNIDYRDASYRERPFGGGRLIRRVEATLGSLSASGANRTEAKKALEAAIERQLTHMRTRRYLSANDVTFALFYNDGWGYDIVRSDRDLGRRTSSTLMGGDMSEQQAFESMKHHFEQYAIEGRETELGVDRTNGELDAAILAVHEEQSSENWRRLEAAQRAHVDAFYAEQAEGFAARVAG